MEPQYKGANGRIDALAVGWLFANDHVFFNDGDVVWDGRHHSLRGLQGNIELRSEAPIFWANGEPFVQGIADFLLQLESDEALIVPRAKIAPGIWGALGDGDLTGITLFNLQACGRAFWFLDDSNATAYGGFADARAGDNSNWETAVNVLRMAGFDALIDDPKTKSATRLVMYDVRLARGIPGFFKLVRKMYEDMLDYNEIDSPFVLVFASARNIDADQYLGDVSEPVEGAENGVFHVETNVEEWRAGREAGQVEGLGSSEERGDAGLKAEEGQKVEAAEGVEAAEAAEDAEAVEEAEAAAKAEGDDDASDRDAIISMLRLLVLTSESSGKSPFSQEMLDELGRAERGDKSVDIEDLGNRMNACVLVTQAADLSGVTFDEGNVAEGRRFSVASPDGWTIVENYEESSLFMTQTRPFVIVQGEVEPGEDLSLRDRIIYSSISGDNEIVEDDKMYGFDDKHWAVRWIISYDRSNNDGVASMKPNVIWDTEVEAVNTKCFVTQHQAKEGPGGIEFDVYPYAADHKDSLRFVFSDDEATSVEALRSMVLAMAKSIKLDKPYVPQCEKTLNKALKGKVRASSFVSMVNDYKAPYVALRQMIFTAAQYKYAAATDSFDEKECTLAGARGIADLSNRAISKFEKFMDAYDVQVKSGYTISELDELLEALEDFSGNVFPTVDIFDSDGGRLIKRAKILDPTDELIAVRNRLEYAKSNGGMPSAPSGVRSSNAAPMSFKSAAQRQGRARKTLSEPFKTDAVPRIEKALNEKVSSSYFIETSEIAANALMAARQSACDDETSSWDSDEDNVVSMARAFSKFNTIICCYYGYFVDALEAQVELGSTPREIEKMAAEVNEFSELVADYFSCGNAYLDSVANSRVSITRPAEYSSIRARWQKINSR